MKSTITSHNEVITYTTVLEQSAFDDKLPSNYRKAL